MSTNTNRCNTSRVPALTPQSHQPIMKSLLYLFTFLILALTACDKTSDVSSFAVNGEGGNADAVALTKAVENESTESDAQKVEEEVVNERKIVRNGELRFETEDLNAARQRVTQAAAKYGGYV